MSSSERRRSWFHKKRYKSFLVLMVILVGLALFNGRSHANYIEVGPGTNINWVTDSNGEDNYWLIQMTKKYTGFWDVVLYRMSYSNYNLSYANNEYFVWLKEQVALPERTQFIDVGNGDLYRVDLSTYDVGQYFTMGVTQERGTSPYKDTKGPGSIKFYDTQPFALNISTHLKAGPQDSYYGSGWRTNLSTATTGGMGTQFNPAYTPPANWSLVDAFDGSGYQIYANQTTGEIGYTNNGTLTKPTQTIVAPPAGAQIIGYDIIYVYAADPTSGKVYKRTLSSTTWTAFSGGSYSDVPVPAGYKFAGLYTTGPSRPYSGEPAILIIDTVTNELKYRYPFYSFWTTFGPKSSLVPLGYEVKTVTSADYSNSMPVLMNILGKADNIAPNPPTLISPLGSNVSSNPVITWAFNDLDAGDIQSGFQVQFSDNPDFSTITKDSGVIAGASTTYTASGSIDRSMTYYRVKTKDSKGAWSGWSSSNYFYASTGIFPVGYTGTSTAVIPYNVEYMNGWLMSRDIYYAIQMEKTSSTQWTISLIKEMQDSFNTNIPYGSDTIWSVSNYVIPSSSRVIDTNVGFLYAMKDPTTYAVGAKLRMGASKEIINSLGKPQVTGPSNVFFYSQQPYSVNVTEADMKYGIDRSRWAGWKSRGDVDNLSDIFKPHPMVPAGFELIDFSESSSDLYYYSKDKNSLMVLNTSDGTMTYPGDNSMGGSIPPLPAGFKVWGFVPYYNQLFIVNPTTGEILDDIFNQWPRRWNDNADVSYTKFVSSPIPQGYKPIGIRYVDQGGGNSFYMMMIYNPSTGNVMYRTPYNSTWSTYTQNSGNLVPIGWEIIGVSGGPGQISFDRPVIGKGRKNNSPPNPPTMGSGPSSTDYINTPPKFTWNFSDPDGDAQAAYQFQFSTDNFVTNYYDTGEVPGSASSYQMSTPKPKEGINYYRYRVKDTNGEWSDWITGIFYYDSIPPKTTAVKITSNSVNNPNAKVGDKVTLTFTVDDQLKQTPVVTMFGRTLTVTGTNPNYTATYTIVAADAKGVNVPFTIDFVDKAGNAATQVKATSDSSYVRNMEDLGIKSSTIYSTNANTSLAKAGDTIKVDVDFNQAVTFTNPKIMGKAATVTLVSGTKYRLSVVVDSTMNGAATVTTDKVVGLGLGQSTGTIYMTDNSSVIVDTIAPTVGSIYSASPVLYRGDILEVYFSFSEPLNSTIPTVTIGGTTAVVTKITSTQYKAQIVVPASQAFGNLNITIKNYSDPAGNAVASWTSPNSVGLVKDGFVAKLSSVKVRTSKGTSQVTDGDTVYIDVTANTPVTSSISAFINGRSPLAQTSSGNTTTLSYKISSADDLGEIDFKLYDISATSGALLAGEIDSSTDGSLATVVRTAPTGSAPTVKISSSNASDPLFAKTGDTISILVTFKEKANSPTVKDNNGRTYGLVSYDGLVFKYTRVVSASDTNGATIPSVSNISLKSGATVPSFDGSTDGSMVKIDTKPPVVNSYSTGSNTITLNFNESITGSFTLTLNGNPLTVIANGTPTFTMPIPGGTVVDSISVSGVKDLAGNSSDEISVIAPSSSGSSSIMITITGVSEGEVATGFKIIAFTGSSSKSPNVTVSGKLDGSNFTSGTPVTAKGSHTLIVTAVDSAGNTDTKQVNFKIQ